MNTKNKNLFIIILTALLVFGFSAASILTPSKDYSMSERRSLAQMPKFVSEQILSGKFMSEFEDYTLDQFPLRDKFRTLKAVSALYLFKKSDNNSLYAVDGYVSKLEYPANPDMIDTAAKKFKQIQDTYLAGTDCNIYLSVIPDKNYFLAPLGNYPSMDYEKFVADIRSQVDFAEYIDVFDKLSLDDYYRTDQHWKQENVIDVAEAIAAAMNTDISHDFTENALDVPFYGTYSGQSALPYAPDSIKYLTNDATNSCSVTSYNTGAPVSIPVYDLDKASGKDAYEMYLGGADALIVIENPNALTDKELVIFRDSFTSSLAPMLISGYSKITLVDLRYMQSGLVGNYVDFDNQDVLFLYSTLIINSSTSLK